MTAQPRQRPPIPWKSVAPAGLLFLAVAAQVCAVHLATPVYPEDDAFITYRYVDNLVAGHGLVYNHGQRVFGASTPLYVALLAAVKAVVPGAATPDLAVRLGMLFYLATGLGLVFLFRRLGAGPGLALALGAGFMLRDDMLRTSTGGMESFLFVALLAWGLWALVGRRWATAALLAGLSAMVRLEGAVTCAVVLAGWLALDRRRPVPVLLGLAGPALAWTAFATAYYGTPVYHSLVAKSRPLYPLPFGHALGRMLCELERRLAGVLGPSETPERWQFSWRTATAGLLAAAGVAGCVSRASCRGGRQRRSADGGDQATSADHSVVGPRRAVALVLGLMLAFYFFLNPLMFPWYYPPLTVLLYLLVGAGGAGFNRSPWPAARWLSVAVLALLVAPGALPPLARTFRGRAPFDVGVADDAVRTRVAAYREVAHWLNANLPAGTTVLASEVGSLGYYYDGAMLDGCGLVSPEALPFLPAPADERSSPTQGVIPSAMVRALRPEAIVTMPVFARRSLYSQDWFWEEYAGVVQFPLPATLWGSSTVDVLIRRDLVADSGGPAALP